MLSNYVAEDRTRPSKKCVLTLDLHYKLSSESEEAKRTWISVQNITGDFLQKNVLQERNGLESADAEL